MEFDRLAPTLRALAGAGDGLHLDELAGALDQPPAEVAGTVHELRELGLVFHEFAEGAPIILADAGRQYLELDGKVGEDVVRFLAGWVDDLHARRALLRAGVVLVDGFRSQLLDGRAVDVARSLVPDAFAAAVDEPFAIDLYAAAVALTTRLSAGQPAGCVAEEVLAVDLLDVAERVLDDEQAAGRLTAAEVDHAGEELNGVFSLFGDDDVLRLFEMAEPADAALARHDPTTQALGVVDQRPEAWFRPFGDVAPTGYLDIDAPGSTGR